MFVNAQTGIIRRANNSEVSGEVAVLIMANNEYEVFKDLRQPKISALQLQETFESLGYNVSLGIDLDKAQMEKIINDYSLLLKGYRSGLIFYLGHGFEVEGSNYLIPTDAVSFKNLKEWDSGISMDDLIKKMELINIPKAYFFDACRENPNRGSGFDTPERGFNDVTIPLRNSVIYYSTQRNSTVFDSNPYMEYFNDEIKKGGCIEDIVKVVSRKVKDNDYEQVPAAYGQLDGEICFFSPFNRFEQLVLLGKHERLLDWVSFIDEQHGQDSNKVVIESSRLYVDSLATKLQLSRINTLEYETLIQHYDNQLLTAREKSMLRIGDCLALIEGIQANIDKNKETLTSEMRLVFKQLYDRTTSELSIYLENNNLIKALNLLPKEGISNLTDVETFEYILIQEIRQKMN